MIRWKNGVALCNTSLTSDNNLIFLPITGSLRTQKISGKRKEKM